MAVTGLILILFLLMHMFGNLKLLASNEEFNRYAGFHVAGDRAAHLVGDSR